jgi:ABC-type branched-subunit amino acid transport system substrate-binding protein
MLIYDETGPGASPELVDGATAGVQQVNSTGGVNGRQLQLVTCKTGDDPNKADDCARQAVSDKVSAIVGELTLQKGHEKILEQAHIPMIGSVTSGTDLTEPAQFPITGSTAVEIPALANAFAALGKTKISLARIQIDGGEAFAGFANAGLKAKGLKVVNDVPVPIGAPDMSSYVQQVLAHGTNAVMVILPGADSTAFLKELYKEAPGMTAALVGTQKEKVADALGSASNGLMEGTSFLPVAYKNAATEAYVAAMTKAGFSEVRGFREQSYAAVQTFAAVAKKVADPTSQAMWDILPKTSGIDIGLTPPLQWTKGGVGGLSRVFTPCEFIVKYEGGKEIPVFDSFKNAYTFANCQTPAKG